MVRCYAFARQFPVLLVGGRIRVLKGGCLRKDMARSKDRRMKFW